MIADLGEVAECEDIEELLESLDRWWMGLGSIRVETHASVYQRRMVEAIAIRLASFRRMG